MVFLWDPSTHRNRKYRREKKKEFLVTHARKQQQQCCARSYRVTCLFQLKAHDVFFFFKIKVSQSRQKKKRDGSHSITLKKKGKRIITYKLHPLCWMTYLKCADWFRLQPHIYLAINGPNRTSIGIHTLLNILVNTIHRGGDRAFYVCFLHICLIESVDVFRIYYLGLYIQHRWRDIYMYKDTMYRVYFSCNMGTIPFIRWQLTRPTVHKSYPFFFLKKKSEFERRYRERRGRGERVSLLSIWQLYRLGASPMVIEVWWKPKKELPVHFISTLLKTKDQPSVLPLYSWLWKRHVEENQSRKKRKLIGPPFLFCYALCF